MPSSACWKNMPARLDGSLSGVYGYSSIRTLQEHVRSSQQGRRRRMLMPTPNYHSDGLTRRVFLQAGGLGMLGASAAALVPPSASQAAPSTAVNAGSFGRAKSAIVLFLYGAPSQMDTLDPKPNAPEE